MTNLVTIAAVYIYIDKLINNKYCNKYKNILYLCNFSYLKRKIM